MRYSLAIAQSISEDDRLWKISSRNCRSALIEPHKMPTTDNCEI